MEFEQLLQIKDYVDKYLSSFTCEAEMKMTGILAGYDNDEHKIKYNFEYADKIYNYANSHGKVMRGHTIIFHTHDSKAKPLLDAYIQDHYNDSDYDGNYDIDSQDSSPKFLKRRKELTLSFLTEYITALVKHYPNCYCWDVLNEIVPKMEISDVKANGGPTEEERKDGLRHSLWFDYIGKDYYIEVLKIARRCLPQGTKLFYNECGEEHLEKRTAIIKVIEKIKSYEEQTGEILLDGIGLQSHYNMMITGEQIEAIYQAFSKTGKEIQVTEMDVALGSKKFIDGKRVHITYEQIERDLDVPGNKIIENIWYKVFECAQKYGVKSFTGWGISDKLSWLKDKVCTMVDKDGKIKNFAKELFKMVKQQTPEQRQESFLGSRKINTQMDIEEEKQVFKDIQDIKRQEKDGQENYISKN